MIGQQLERCFAGRYSLLAFRRPGPCQGGPGPAVGRKSQVRGAVRPAELTAAGAADGPGCSTWTFPRTLARFSATARSCSWRWRSACASSAISPERTSSSWTVARRSASGDDGSSDDLRRSACWASRSRRHSAHTASTTQSSSRTASTSRRARRSNEHLARSRRSCTSGKLAEAKGVLTLLEFMRELAASGGPAGSHLVGEWESAAFEAKALARIAADDLGERSGSTACSSTTRSGRCSARPTCCCTPPAGTVSR